MAQGTTRGVPIDTDPLLTADSDLLVPSQKAIKAYADTKEPALGYTPANRAGDNFTGNIDAPSMSLNGVNLESLMIAYAVALG